MRKITRLFVLFTTLPVWLPGTYAQTRTPVNYAGIYSPAITYNNSDLVSSSGSLYISVVSNNLGFLPSGSPSQWTPMNTQAGTSSYDPTKNGVVSLSQSNSGMDVLPQSEANIAKLTIKGGKLVATLGDGNFYTIPLTYTDVVAMFGAGSCSGTLNANGTCTSASTGTGTGAGTGAGGGSGGGTGTQPITSSGPCSSGTCSDAFAGTAGTTLQVHNANWLDIFGNNVNLALTGSGAVTLIGNPYGVGGAYFATSTSDTCTVVVSPFNDENTRKYCAVRSGSGVIGYSAVFSKWVQGAWTAVEVLKNNNYLGYIAAGSWNASTNHTMTITASGNSSVALAVSVDGAPVGSATDSWSPVPSGHPSIVFIGDGVAGNNLLGSWQDH